MSKKRQVLKYFLILAIAIALCRVTLFSLRFLLGSEFPLVIVEGRSMEPTFYEGDLLILRGVEDKRTIKLQDVIVFYYVPYGKDKLIVHRVVEIVSNSQLEFITQGDNKQTNYNVKETVREADVVGVYVYKVPPIVGSIVLVVESPALTIFTVAIIIVDVGVSIFHDESKKGGSDEKLLYKGEKAI